MTNQNIGLGGPEARQVTDDSQSDDQGSAPSGNFFA